MSKKQTKIKAWAVIDTDKGKVAQSVINNISIFGTKKEAQRFGGILRFKVIPCEVILK